MKLFRSTLFLATTLAITNLNAAPEGTGTKDVPAAEAPEPVTDAAAQTGWLGIASSPVGTLLTTQLDLPEGVGVAVRLVFPESPAAKAGIEIHDVLFEFEGEPIRSPEHLGELVRARAGGDSVEFSLVQRGAKKSATVTIGTRPKHLPEVPRELLQMPDQIDMGDLPFKVMPLAGDDELDVDAKKQMKEMRRRLQQQFKGMLKLEGLNNLPGKGEIVGSGIRTMTFSDADGSVQIRGKDGTTSVIVKDTEGVIVFEGLADSEEDRDKLPAGVREKLELFENSPIELDFGSFKLPDPQMRVPELKPAKKADREQEQSPEEDDKVPSAKKVGKKVAT